MLIALRALLATLAFANAALAGCTYDFDAYLPRESDLAQADATGPDAPLRDGGADAQREDARVDTRKTDAHTDDTHVEDTHVEDTHVEDTFVLDGPVEDTAVVDTGSAADACTCVHWVGAKCKEWSPPGCGD